MPNPKRLDAGVKKTLLLRGSLVAQVDASLVDKLTNEPTYGAWKTLVEELLELWLKGQAKTSLQPIQIDLTDLEKSNV